MKCIVYPSPTGVWITTPAPRTVELRAAAEISADIDRQIADINAVLDARPPAKSEADADDIKALKLKRDVLLLTRRDVRPPSDNERILVMAENMYPDGGFLIVDKADLPTTGDSATDWVIRDGKVELR